jgi:hypothetical protein
MWRRCLLFFYSTPHIVGSVLGLLGLLLFFTGVIKSFWFFIVAGLYAVGVMVTPRSPTYDLQLNQQLTRAELQQALQNLVNSIRDRVPAEILAKVQSITQSIAEALPYIENLDSGEYDVHVLRQMALDYLPSTMQNYLNLPKAYARLHPVKDGKTATQLLSEQLTLLDRKLVEIVEDIHRKDTERMLVHGRFLEDKFRQPEDWLGSGST